MTEGNYSNVGHRGPVYEGLGAMNPCDNLQSTIYTQNISQNTSYILILLKLGYVFQLFRVVIGTIPRTYKVIVHSGIPYAYKGGIMYSTSIY
jgi:hypothetical protein